jgi:hypothetical protein
LADATSNRPNVGLVSSSFFISVSVMLRLTAIALFKYAALTAITADRPEISSILPCRRVSRTKRKKVIHSDRVVSIAFRLIRPLGHAMMTESVSWMPLTRESFFMLLKAGQLDQDCLVLLRDDSELQGSLMR